jgi:hypothetical protein
MSLRLVATFALVLAPLAVRAADEEHPFRKAKVGDYAKYNALLREGTTEVKLLRTQTVTAASDKEVTLKSTTELNGKEVTLGRTTHKIDLSVPFDPVGDGQDVSPIAGLKWEKSKDGKENLKVGGKEYECTWTTYKPVMPANATVEGEVKVWLCKDVPFVVKRTLTIKFAKKDVAFTTELIEFGSKK